MAFSLPCSLSQIFLAYYRSFARQATTRSSSVSSFSSLPYTSSPAARSKPHPSLLMVNSLGCTIGIGALGAASFLLRPNLVALWIAIGIYWLLIRGYSLRKLAWAVLGGVSVLFPVAALFAALGAWGALWDAVFIFNFAHSNVSLPERLHVVRNLSRRTVSSIRVRRGKLAHRTWLRSLHDQLQRMSHARVSWCLP